MTPERIDEAYALQREVDTVVTTAAIAQDTAIKQFLRLAPSLSDAELESLATECGEETGPDHCVFCAAWNVLVERGN